MQNGKNVMFPCSVFSPADPKFLSEDTSQNVKVSEAYWHYICFNAQLLLFWFKLFRSADKIDEDDATGAQLK